MKDKIKSINSITDDLKYLCEEYQSIKLWGSCPDGDVEFEKALEWVTKNKHVVEHMIKVGESIESLSK